MPSARAVVPMPPLVEDSTEARFRSGSRRRVAPTVLVVDDCDDTRDLFSAVLEREGFRVITASDGADALAAAALHRPRVVVTDLAMPAMDGFEVVRRLRAAQRANETLCVLVVSAFNDSRTVARARAAGCDDYLVKPCTGPALVDRVRAALED